MKEFHGQASARVDAEPQAMFDLITDVGLLPDWQQRHEVRSPWRHAPPRSD